MNRGANIARHLSTGPKVNGQQNFTGFIKFLLPIRSDYFTGKRFRKRDFHTTGTRKRLCKCNFHIKGAGKRLPKCESGTSVTGRRSPKCEMATTVAGLSVTVVAFSHFGNLKYIEFDSLGVNRTSFGFYHYFPHGHWCHA